MHLYIAGLYTSNFDIFGSLYRRCTPGMKALRDGVVHKLESYHYIHKGAYVDKIRRAGDKVFLDSGAFSAFSLGVEVDINAYAEFVKSHQDIILMASVLDAIGDPEGTYRNQQTLERLGAEVLPCFHYGEPLDLCEHYISNYPYITIGGMVPIPNSKLEYWLDEIWSKVLTGKDGVSRGKVHGFGLTSRKLMLKYPWYSCDSSSWVQMAAHGSIVFPEIDQTIAVSKRHPSTKDFGRHLDTLPAASQELVQAMLHYYGLTLPEVQDIHDGRWALNCFSYDRLGQLLGEDHWRKPFRTTLPTLF